MGQLSNSGSAWNRMDVLKINGDDDFAITGICYVTPVTSSVMTKMSW